MISFEIGSFSLSINDIDPNKGNTVKHYRIRGLDNGGYYITTRTQFQELSHLIEHYMSK